MMRAGIFFILAAVLMVSLMRYGAAAETDYGDIVFSRKTPGADEIPPAVFPHWAHRINFKCYVCHDAIFQMKAGANPVTMENIQQGKFCGACHNGKIAFPAGFDTCDRCHHQ
jgi:c(7)-type cytochrome triheme protein